MPINRREMVKAALASALGASPARALAASDQTARLQAQIDAAQAGSGLLALPPGIYSVSTLSITGPVAISGVPGKTILRSLHGGPILQVSDAEGVRLSGLTFDGASAPAADEKAAGDSYLVAARNCAALRIEGCSFRNAAVSGLGLDRCSGWVKDNQFHALAEVALRAGRFSEAAGNAAHGLEISGNRVSDMGNGGIYIFHAGAKPGEDSSLITGNHIEGVRSASGNGPNGNGIDVFNAAHVTVANNRVTDCAFGGIRVVSSKNCVVTGNTVSAIADAGIFVEFAFEAVSVTSNVVDDCSLGIEMSGGEGTVGVLALCANNIVRNIARPATNPQSANFIGIDLAAMAATCQGNVIERIADNAHGPGIGIAVFDWQASHEHLVAGNMIRAAACGIGIVSPPDAGGPPIAISGNMISGASIAAITMLEQETFADGSAKSLKPTGEDLAKAAAPAAHISLSGNITAP